MVEKLSLNLSFGSFIYLSSDCKAIAEKMKEQFINSGCFSFLTIKQLEELSSLETKKIEDWKKTSFPRTYIPSSEEEDDEDWLPFNPLDVPSERELVCEVDWRPVYRCILVRNFVLSPTYTS
jgi:hypothetical protein